ncbi:MAG: hypothetical protein GF330_01760 [Candidatus Eisenbacteria bacterium]|nr:hypothetical protein [Candidatus Eisenbacteria bacterium]
MDEQVELLHRLRQLDDRLERLRSRIAARQGDLQRCQAEADLVAQALERERERLKDAQSKRREADMEVQTFRQRKAHFETQMTQVKTNEEFLALQREIATMEKKAREWEDVVLEAMEEEELNGQRVAQLESEIAVKQQTAGQEQERVEAERTAAEAQAAEINARRSELVGALRGAVRAKYERLRAAKPDGVIVPVRDGGCGGCHYRLPPQTVNEVRQGRRMILCESCGRILVWAAEDVGT